MDCICNLGAGELEERLNFSWRYPNITPSHLLSLWATYSLRHQASEVRKGGRGCHQCPEEPVELYLWWTWYGLIQWRGENCVEIHLDASFSDDYIHYAKKHMDSFVRNKRLWKYCKDGKNQNCYKSDLLNQFCSIFPFHSMKTVRIRANLSRELLKDNRWVQTCRDEEKVKTSLSWNPGSLNVRVLLLVRDPRGTLQSRKHREWCPRQPDCSDPKVLCQDLVDDYRAAKTMLRDFPARFRYETWSITICIWKI